jgi:rare lipoprotein A
MRSMKTLSTLLILLIAPLVACAAEKFEEGKASYYHDSLAGNSTASGEPYDPQALTAAHKTLEFGTRVRVTYLKNDKSVDVVINDRGPHVDDRIIDLSRAAAEAIDLIDDGTGVVRVDVL